MCYATGMHTKGINNCLKISHYLSSPNSYGLICFSYNTLTGWMKGYMYLLSVNTNGEQELFNIIDRVVTRSDKIKVRKM